MLLSKRLSALIFATQARLRPGHSASDKGPTLWQWIKLFLDADDETRQRLLESAEIDADREGKIERKRAS